MTFYFFDELVVNRRPFLVMVLCHFVAMQWGNAQDLAPQARLSQDAPTLAPVSVNSPSVKNGSTVASTSEELESFDIGDQQILLSQESFQPFSLSLSTGLMYTSNAALSSVNELDDWAWTSSVALQWNPKLTQSILLDVGVREDFYRYDRFKDTLDFDAFKVSAGVLYFPSFLPNTFLFSRYALQITTQPLDWDEALYLNQSFQVGVQRNFYFSKGNQVQVMIAGEFSFDTEPDLLRRHDYAFQVAHALRWTPRIQSSLVYRMAYNDYVNLDDMSSWNQILSARIQYAFTDWMSLALSGSLVHNEANHSRFDYEVFTSAFSLDLQFKF